MSLERAYYPSGQDCVKTACQSISEVQMTDVAGSSAVMVRLTLTLPNDMYQLMVQDTIPAGFEIFNPRLKTSQLGSGGEPSVTPDYDPSNPFGKGWGWWYFNDPGIYDDHILWTSDYVPAGTYQLTYMLIPYTRGEYRAIPARAWQFNFPGSPG